MVLWVGRMRDRQYLNVRGGYYLRVRDNYCLRVNEDDELRQGRRRLRKRPGYMDEVHWLSRYHKSIGEMNESTVTLDYKHDKGC